MGSLGSDIPPEIMEYKEKFFFGLTVRQLGCAAGALALAVPTGLIGINYMSQDMFIM